VAPELDIDRDMTPTFKLEITDVANINLHEGAVDVLY
jgi:hypothetical protein